MRLRATLSAATLTAAAISVAVPAIPASAQTQPAFCGSTGSIPAAQITAPVNLAHCNIVGREVTGTRLGLGVPVPAAGHSITSNALTRHGEYMITATNTRGILTVRISQPGPEPRARINADPACSENGFNSEGASWGRGATVKWFYNSSTASRAGLSASTTLSDIRAANTDMTTGVNNCGFKTNTFDVHGSYQGNTSRFANINSLGQCTSKFPDGQNTVSWGPFTGSALSNGTLAVTCFEHSGTTMTEADIYIGSNVHMVDSLPSHCTDQFDLQTVVVHEWGHFFGLAHETSGVDEIMYPFKSPCELRRHLGKGDYNGMSLAYI